MTTPIKSGSTTVATSISNFIMLTKAIRTHKVRFIQVDQPVNYETTHLIPSDIAGRVRLANFINNNAQNLNKMAKRILNIDGVIITPTVLETLRTLQNEGGYTISNNLDLLDNMLTQLIVEEKSRTAEEDLEFAHDTMYLKSLLKGLRVEEFPLVSESMDTMAIEVSIVD